MAIFTLTNLNDRRSGTNAGDTFYGLPGDDDLSGLDGDDTLFGGYGDDALQGDDGDDFIWGDFGDDVLYGNAGDDRLMGEDGDDSLHAGGGDDLLSGGSDADTLRGGTGDDTVQGGGGDDMLFGGRGNDVLLGGAGADAFVFGVGFNRVDDFSRVEGDVIDLRSALDAFANGSDPVLDFVRVTRNAATSNVTISIDANGMRDGSADFRAVGSLSDVGYADLDAMQSAGAILLPSRTESSNAHGSVSDFRNFLGVNISLLTGTTQLERSGTLIDALDYLNITNVRVGAYSPTSSNSTASVYEDLADHGIKFDFLMRRPFVEKGDPFLEECIEHFKAFLREHPGSIKSIEGVNEVGEGWDVSYNGHTGKDAATAYQKALYRAVNSDDALKDIPVLNFTVHQSKEPENLVGFEDVSNFSDAANVHAYIGTKLVPYVELQIRIDQVEALDRNSPAVVTEFGYQTDHELSNMIKVDQLTQAKLILNMIMNAYEQKVESSYIFDLFDARDPDLNPDYGIFTRGGAAKQSATAIHNLTEILYKGTGAGAVDTVGYDLDGDDANTHSVALEKAGGVTDLIIWQEERIWDGQTATRIEAEKRTIEIELGEVVETANVYDPILGTSRQRQFTDTDSITVEVTDHPIIVELLL